MNVRSAIKRRQFNVAPQARRGCGFSGVKGKWRCFAGGKYMMRVCVFNMQCASLHVFLEGLRAWVVPRKGSTVVSQPELVGGLLLGWGARGGSSQGDHVNQLDLNYN